MVDAITAGDSLDARLDRRLKRRVVANKKRKSSYRRTAKRNAREGGCDLVDGEYWVFLNSLPEFVEDSDGIVEAKPVDFGHHDNDNDNGGPSRCEWLDGDVDPIYMTFFQHLTKEGKSYKLEIPSVNGRKVYVKYEEEDHLFGGPRSSLKNDRKQLNTGTTRILRSASRKEKIESPEKSFKVFGHEKKPLEGLNAFSRGIKNSPLSGSPAKESMVPLVEEEFNLDCAKPISPGLNRLSNTKTGTGLLRSAEHPSLSDSKSDMIDEDYKTFLTYFLYDDDDHHRLAYMPVDGRSIVYEDDESTSDSEVVVMVTDPCKPARASFRGKSFHAAMDVDSGKCLQCPATYKSSNFRERLMICLRSPYDQNEYNYLLEEASFCRERVRWRELRNGVLKPYPLGSCAKSYLDLYGELAIKIGETPYDRPRILNLLRGFFYWLQNLSHDDAFQPWMDPTCLNVLPQS